MENQELVVYSSEQSISLTARDIAAMGFRHRKAFIICFFAVLLGTALVAATLPLYESHTEILVRMNRVDPVVTATKVKDIAGVVARAVEYEGEWPIVGGVNGTTLRTSELLKIGERVRGMFAFPHLLLLRPPKWKKPADNC